jgi:predicted amidohydrolase YtcJ
MFSENPELQSLRHRIEHSEVTNVEDIPRFAQLGVRFAFRTETTKALWKFFTLKVDVTSRF